MVEYTLEATSLQFLFQLVKASELSKDERRDLWEIWEKNMYEMYKDSSFGWDPPAKKRELFHRLARFIVVRENTRAQGSQDDGNNAVRIVAFTVFRFEYEFEENIVYCYELQVCDNVRRYGLGKYLMQQLVLIGKEWGMTKVVLTVFKANSAARNLYMTIGFEVDPTSPEYERPDADADADANEDEGESESVHSRAARGRSALHTYQSQPSSSMPPTSSLRTLQRQFKAPRSASASRRYASHGHGPQYNEPSGYLFGEKPLPPGQKRQRESWEIIWHVGMLGTMGVTAVLLYYKPDSSIQTWALEEAKARMEARGEKTDYP
ncbi:N-alpha-acetyltransferase 40 [Grifola frondosa]|uniref:N-alpha-acetyltransferase 40 n=1 Tax=Grifola frondosa TaxID=5627 RepID=A0A1C7MRW2_GRIFR|nr:N-alpha-acetyltransferase 40 [Grifola frondosa]